MSDQTTGNDEQGGVALLADTDFDPEVCDRAAKAAQTKLRRLRATRRHDADYTPRDLS